MGLTVKINRAPLERVRLATELLNITPGDMAGPVLIRVGEVHREQEKEVFSTQGATSIVGRWAPLSADYAARKKAALLSGRRELKASGFKKKEERSILRGLMKRPISMNILVWSGDMRDRFLRVARPEYIQRALVAAGNVYLMQFGAASDIASYHAQLEGSGVAFGSKLPRRDMITKTEPQRMEMLKAIVDWYRNERVPQVIGYLGSASRGQSVHG
jgi:hypothetical protein